MVKGPHQHPSFKHFKKNFNQSKINNFTGYLNNLRLMDVKIDTKEKFTVITPKESDISANMTDDLAELLISYMARPIPHVILNMKLVNSISVEAADVIAGLQQQFYEKNSSFIVCELQNNPETLFKSRDLLETMNVTPTESEAWDILQMEEIERELMADFDNNPEE
jgi:anti-anti-sigma factor